MSSEETLSIGGNEELKMLEYSDISIESESSGSERTKGGVGRNEVVEVWAEKVPVNILEVGDRSDKCYDSGADIVSEVKGYESKLRSRNSLSYLVDSYEISSRVLIRPAGVKERACSAPKDHWMPVYAHYLATRLRFPVPDLLVWLLLEYSVGLTQLSPNAIRVIIGFVVYCRAKGVRVPTINMFKHFFVLKAGSRKEKGWYYFTPRSSNKEKRNLFSAGPSSIKGWKEKFFFVDDTEWEKGDGEEKVPDFGEGCVAKGGGHMEKGQMSSTEPRAAEEVELRSKRKRDEVDQAQKKKRRMEEEVRRDEVVEFVPRPAPVELDPDLKETENFINAYVPEVDRREAREKVLLHRGTSIVRHTLEIATWVNALAQEFLELVKECNNLQKEKDELLKKNGEMKRELDIVVPTVTSLQEERDTLKTILSFKEKKKRMCEEENDAQEEEIRRMEEHINNFINSSTFDNIVNLYLLPTTILAFTDCRKKVKTEYPEVDITKITFGKQEEGVEENGESLSTDFRPQVELRWDHDEQGRVFFPLNFNFEFVVVEEEEGEAKGAKVEKSQPSPPVKVHPIPLEEEQPSLPTKQEPQQPPPPAE
ncbi:hypothetical protein SLEP1_g44140 [Rubroshorea leprosula]|uniref:Transposase (putative) gypsy type domain-containing protein n=1 Tax=Rubroshorea leprosula TaxID=152421 RepID=A0AAV5LF87_9ROSI|nr:hypothetical protein SLEP1_g44140 [Rubroshorea leprosula]